MLKLTRRNLALAAGMAAAVALSAGALIAFSAEASSRSEPDTETPDLGGMASQSEWICQAQIALSGPVAAVR